MNFHRLIIFVILLAPVVLQSKESQYSQEENKAFSDLVKNNYTGAIFHYKRAIALRKNNPSDYLRLNQIYGFLKMDHESLEILEEGVKRNPKSVDLLTRYAYHNERMGNYREAKGLYERILKIDKNNSYAKYGLIRTSNIVTFKFYTEYKISDSKNRDRSGLNVINDKFETKTITQKISKYVANSFNLGLEYHNNKHRKKAFIEHNVKEENFSISLDKIFKKFFVSTSLGQSSYRANNVGSGSQGKESLTSGSLLVSYYTSRNTLSLSFSRDYYAQDLGSSVDMEDLKVYDLQDQFSLTKSLSLLGQVTNGNSDNLEYVIYKLSPYYNFSKIKGLGIYLSLERFDIKNSSNYSEQSLGINYARDWSDKFESSFHLEYGRQDITGKNLLFSELVTKYNFTQSKALILSFEASHDYGNVDTKTYGGSLALDMYF